MKDNKLRLLEILAVVITGAGKFIFVEFVHLKFWYITVACLGWIAYILYWIKRDRSITQHWGFRKEGFRSSLKVVLPVSAVVLALMIGAGLIRGTWILNWHLLPVLILYPVWGTIQQFLIIGLIAGNLSDSTRNISKTVIILLPSVVFAAVHFPVLPLVMATFFLAIFYVVLFLRYRNLWILGLFHGWLGGFFYMFVLGRDPWLEFIQAIQ